MPGSARFTRFVPSLLRSRAVEAGLDPQFAVLEQAQAETLLSEAVDDEMRRLVGARDEDDARAGRAVWSGRSARHGAAVGRWRARHRLLGEWLARSPEELRRSAGAEFSSGLRSQTGGRSRASREAATHGARRSRETRARARRDGGSGAQALLDALEHLSERVPARSRCWSGCEQIAPSCAWQGGGGRKVWPSAEAYETFRDAATELRKLIEKLRDVAAFDPADARDAAVLGMQLLDAGRRRLSHAMPQRKTELRVLDFNDLLVRARALLVDGDQAGTGAAAWDRASRCCWSTSFRTPIPCRSSWSRRCAARGCGRASCFSWATTSNRSIAFAGPIRTCFATCGATTPRAGRQSLSLQLSQPAGDPRTS